MVTPCQCALRKNVTMFPVLPDPMVPRIGSSRCRNKKTGQAVPVSVGLLGLIFREVSLFPFLLRAR